MQIIETNRIQLPLVELKGEDGNHDLLDDRVTLNIENGKSKSFYFEYMLPLPLKAPFKNIDVHLVIHYLSPFFGEVRTIKKKIF